LEHGSEELKMEDTYNGQEEAREVYADPMVRLKLLTRNARLIDARKKWGLTQKNLADMAEIEANQMSFIENLKRIPTEQEAANISCVLDKPVEELFPPEIIAATELGVFDKRKMEVDLGALQVTQLTQGLQKGLLTTGIIENVDEEVDRELLSEQLQKVMDATLEPREKKVLELRFGLTGKPPMTLEEVGREFEVNRERVRQIEGKAIRKLRHPTRARFLKPFVEGCECSWEPQYRTIKDTPSIQRAKMKLSKQEYAVVKLPEMVELRKQGHSYVNIAAKFKLPVYLVRGLLKEEESKEVKPLELLRLKPREEEQ